MAEPPEHAHQVAGQSGAPLLQLDNVSVNYGKFRALTDVSYKIYPGQIVALLGGNASGKSTSMKTISGTTTVTAGELFWKGEVITHEPTPRRMARGIGVVPEGRRMFASLTVLENLQLGAWAGSQRRATSDDIAEMLDLFPPLKNLVHRPSGVLSGGEQQMVAFARALIRHPELVIMDEPSMGLAPALVKRVFEIIEEIRSRKIAVFIVEQNARAALRIADYAYVLAAGQVVLEGTPDMVATAPMMTEAYLGKRS
ncbi:ABC transporter ATP-binding protein [Mesorhizobium sp. AR10]|uniref:ABC transporter ATP-binding protein n=1 Tax=Mesorhizobium sp. AR10 TaxID=2865839 RepID=UPI00215FF221|nr:ABC transporter ATP-binding protein [Mesorhizobium sp. AR10]UVK37883.1 ABC transporter ATP-binding protein [Mesorhizobium sp. AR10]